MYLLLEIISQIAKPYIFYYVFDFLNPGEFISDLRRVVLNIDDILLNLYQIKSSNNDWLLMPSSFA